MTATTEDILCPQCGNRGMQVHFDTWETLSIPGRSHLDFSNGRSYCEEKDYRRAMITSATIDEDTQFLHCTEGSCELGENGEIPVARLEGLETIEELQAAVKALYREYLRKHREKAAETDPNRSVARLPLPGIS